VPVGEPRRPRGPRQVYRERRSVPEGRPRLFQNPAQADGAHAQAEAVRPKLDKSRYEFQMIYGTRRDLQEQVHSAGDILQAYVPFGTDWCPYFMRRLSERPANCWFVLRSLMAESGSASRQPDA